METQQKVWRKDDVLALLESRDEAVVRAVKGLYARQTAHERNAQATHEANGAGFNAHDARFLSDVAASLPKWGDRMTPRQLAVSRKMLRKYWRQLLEIIQEKGGVVEFPNSRKTAIAKSSVEDHVMAVEANQAKPEIANWGMF